MPPLLIPAGLLRPTPTDFAGIACALCDRFCSRWEMVPPSKGGGVVFLCSACVLYTSPFAKLPALQRGLEPFAGQVEEALGRPLTRDSNHRLCGEDADRIVFAILVLSNRRKD